MIKPVAVVVLVQGNPHPLHLAMYIKEIKLPTQSEYILSVYIKGGDNLLWKNFRAPHPLRKISSKACGASEMVHVSYLIWDYLLFTLARWATFAKYTRVNIEIEIKNLFHRTFHIKAVFISKMNLKLERTFSVGLYWEWMGSLCVFNFSC